MRIKFVVLMILLAVVCLNATGCTVGNKHIGDSTSPNSGSSSDSSLAPPLSTEIWVHSWQELKTLYEASKKKNEDFISILNSLDKECTHPDNTSHMSFGYGILEEVEVFLRLFNSVDDRSLLIPRNELEASLDYIRINPVAGGISLAEVYEFVYNGKGYHWSVGSGDFREEMEQKNGDPLDVITGNGYSVKIWLFEREGEYQAYQGYVVLEGDDYPTIKVQLTNEDVRPDNIPKELLPGFGKFEITTVEEMLASINP